MKKLPELLPLKEGERKAHTVTLRAPHDLPPSLSLSCGRLDWSVAVTLNYGLKWAQCKVPF